MTLLRPAADPRPLAEYTSTALAVRAAIAVEAASSHLADARAALAAARWLRSELTESRLLLRSAVMRSSPSPLARPVVIRRRTDARPPSEEERLAALHRAYVATRDPAVAAVLVDQYAPYATSLARRLHRGRESLDDLVQVAMEGLMLALGRFDPDRGVPFPGFAAPTILGTIRRFFRDSGYAVKVPRPAHDIAAPARDAADRLAQQLGRSPTVAEVAGAIGTDEETLLLHLSALEARRPASLDAPMRGADDPLGAVVGDHDPDLRRSEDRFALAQSLTILDERDRRVLELYYGEELTQSEIAERFGVSQVQVSRWLASALNRLRARMTG